MSVSSVLRCFAAKYQSGRYCTTAYGTRQTLLNADRHGPRQFLSTQSDNSVLALANCHGAPPLVSLSRVQAQGFARQAPDGLCSAVIIIPVIYHTNNERRGDGRLPACLYLCLCLRALPTYLHTYIHTYLHTYIHLLHTLPNPTPPLVPPLPPHHLTTSPAPGPRELGLTITSLQPTRPRRMTVGACCCCPRRRPSHSPALPALPALPLFRRPQPANQPTNQPTKLPGQPEP
ncbi:hypothetical protein F4803DRAFT_318170 [Xylaria telfairii]|nr:hypothetical protein F4803DRAFT_318170 [Xylaria telfairii]